MNKFNYFILIILLSFQLNAVECSPQLQPYLTKMEQLPSIRKLIKDVEKEGPIEFVLVDDNDPNFQACWDVMNRRIILNKNRHLTDGEIFISMVFELHNAKTDRKFDQVAQMALDRKLSKSHFVEGIERIEYENAIEALRILQDGINQGLFPVDALWPVPPSFKEHMRLQRMAGHTISIEEEFDDLTAI